MGLNDVTFRHARVGDRSTVLELADHFLAQTRYGDLFAAEPGHMVRLFDACLNAGVIVLAERELPLRRQHAVGFLALIVVEHLMSGERLGEELAWWVEPEARRGRVGMQLLSAAEDWLTAHGIGVLKMVAPAWSRVGHTYERWGYEPVETAYIRRLTDGDVRRTARAADHDAGGRDRRDGAGGAAARAPRIPGAGARAWSGAPELEPSAATPGHRGRLVGGDRGGDEGGQAAAAQEPRG